MSANIRLMDGIITKTITLFANSGAIFLGLGALIIGYLLALLTRKSLNKIMGVYEWSSQIGPFISTTIFYTIIAISMMICFSTMGIDMAPLIASLGLGGFALGFALRDAISNLLAGLMIIIYRPFSRGSLITVADSEGKVVEITLRYTELDTGDGSTVLIPNQLIFSKPVKVKKES